MKADPGQRDSFGCIMYTIGSSTRTMEEFLGLLKLIGVDTVVDVRRFPKSRYPHFVREALEVGLPCSGISYRYIGGSMGGFRRGGYESHMQTAEFMDGLNTIEALGRSYTVAIMCAERMPWRCHRRWIARALMERGWPVVHVIDPGKVWIEGHGVQLAPFSVEQIRSGRWHAQ